MTPLLLRDAIPEDKQALAALESRTFGAGDFPLSSRMFGYHLHKKTPLLVATAEGKIVGYVLLFCYPKSGRIYSLAVDGAWRKVGAGGLLLEAALARLRTLGKKRVILEVRADNAPALRLYATKGFTPFGIKKSYYPDGMDAVRMECLL